MKWLLVPICVASGIIIMSMGHSIGRQKYEKLAEAEKAVRLEKERKIENLAYSLEEYQKVSKHYQDLSDFYRSRGDKLYVDLLASLKNTEASLRLVRDYEARLDTSLHQTERALFISKACEAGLEASMRQTDEAIRAAIMYRGMLALQQPDAEITNVPDRVPAKAAVEVGAAGVDHRKGRSASERQPDADAGADDPGQPVGEREGAD